MVDPKYLADLERYHAYYKLALTALVRRTGTLVVEVDEGAILDQRALRHTANTKPNGTRVITFDLVEKK